MLHGGACRSSSKRIVKVELPEAPEIPIRRVHGCSVSHSRRGDLRIGHGLPIPRLPYDALSEHPRSRVSEIMQYRSIHVIREAPFTFGVSLPRGRACIDMDESGRHSTEASARSHLPARIPALRAFR